MTDVSKERYELSRAGEGGTANSAAQREGFSAVAGLLEDSMAGLCHRLMCDLRKVTLAGPCPHLDSGDKGRTGKMREWPCSAWLFLV